MLFSCRVDPRAPVPSAQRPCKFRLGSRSETNRAGSRTLEGRGEENLKTGQQPKAGSPARISSADVPPRRPSSPAPPSAKRAAPADSVRPAQPLPSNALCRNAFHPAASRRAVAAAPARGKTAPRRMVESNRSSQRAAVQPLRLRRPTDSVPGSGIPEPDETVDLRSLPAEPIGLPAGIRPDGGRLAAAGKTGFHDGPTGPVGLFSSDFIRRLLLRVIAGYRSLGLNGWISVFGLVPPSCRFVPTCSVYAGSALSQYSIGRGIGLCLCRLLRCHPLHPGGWDPVP